MEIHRHKLDIERFNAIPEKERALFVLLGHSINEVNILNKLFYVATQYADDAPKWHVHSQLSQALVLARVLIGKLNEAWELLRTGYFGAQISRDYASRFGEEATAALTALKAYFNTTNAISTVRNKFAFHYSVDEAKTALRNELPEDELLIYLADSNSNALFYFAEVVVNTALMEAVVPGDPKAGFEKIFDETQQVVRWYNDVASEIMSITLRSHLARPNQQLEFETIDIGDAAVAEDARIPYFVLSRQAGQVT